MAKSPAYQWYPKDILSSARVAELDLKEEGAYRRALDYCWLNGHLPNDAGKLARIIGKMCTPKIAAAIIPLFEVNEADNSQLLHERLEEERKKQRDFAERQSVNGKLGGRPKKYDNQQVDKIDGKGLGFSGETQTKPKKSSSSASSIAISISKEIDNRKRSLFNSFYEAYGKKLAKSDAEKAWMKIDVEQMPGIIEKAREYSSSITDPQFQPYPASWLNGRRWEDQIAPKQEPKPALTPDELRWQKEIWG